MSQQYERIMVAVDGSYESELAFIKGVHVAKRNNAQLLLVHVIDTRALQSVATFDSYIYEKTKLKLFWLTLNAKPEKLV